jgi:mannitol/fructose-specific phosphotransferase system IIA component (Ntr-type)
MRLLKDAVKKMTSEAILVNIEADDWKDAVKTSGELLYKLGKVSKEYIAGMIKTTKRLGPYAVIAPGVALPHARPEDGAIDIGISVVILRTSVDFDSPNDPVKIVIGFSAPTNSQHLQLLKELAILLSNREFRKRLRRAKTSENVISIFREAIENFGVGVWEKT